MTNRSTKKALVSSILVLVLCFTMLLGTTFAWFTDSASSVGNKIVAGNLDVELKLWTSETESTEINKDSDPLFSADTIWEPGKTEVVYLSIENKGSLDLKYTVGLEVYGITKDLDKVMSYAITPDATYGELDAWVGNGTNVVPGTNATTANSVALEADGEHFFALSVHMDEEAGNEYMNGSIVFDIKVLATQLASEYDSFGNQYDKDAFYYDALVTNTEEFYTAVENATGDVIIAVDGNITLTKALSNNKLRTIKFIGNGDDATIDQAKYNMYFTGAGVTFENLTLTHGEKTYGDGGQTSTAFAVWSAKSVSYVDCTFNRSVGTIHADVHNFIGCTFNGVENPDNSKSEYPLYICSGMEYNVVDCTFYCTNRGAILFYNDGGNGTDTLNISNTRFYGDIIADKTAVEIHNASTSQVYNVNIKDVTVGSGIINGLYRVKPANVGEVNVTVDGVENVTTAHTTAALTSALNNAAAGDTVYLDGDINVGTTQFAINKDVTLDLNGQDFTTSNNYGGMTVANGGSIKNGTINHTGNTAAIKVSGNAGEIENVTINMTPTAGKTKTGIQVYNGKYVESIKNVTITGTTQGIEVAKGSRVDLIENVNVKTVDDGAKKGVALLVNAASVGKAVNCTFEGSYGVYMMLNGEFNVSLELENCTVTGTEAAFIAHDEVGKSNTNNCSLTFTYDANTTFAGEFVWSFEEECLGVVTLNRP